MYKVLNCLFSVISGIIVFPRSLIGVLQLMKIESRPFSSHIGIRLGTVIVDGYFVDSFLSLIFSWFCLI